MNPPLAIRADAYPSLGTGHLMRCLALAQAWADAGGPVRFTSCCQSPALAERVAGEGFELQALAEPCPGGGEPGRTLDILAQSHPPGEWVVLDGYHFGTDMQRAVRRAGYRVLVVDDYHHLERYEADALLNQNIYAPDMDYACPPDTALLLGCRYALLRREFPARGRKAETARPKARNLLVTLGGADPDNATETIVSALAGLKVDGLHVKVVAGPANPHADSLARAASGVPGRVELLPMVTDMPGLMAWADAAVSAAGSTCWELCYMGVPFLAVILAENQAGIARGLDLAGAAGNLGWSNALDPKAVLGELEKLLKDEQGRAAMSRAGRKLVDGNGAARVAQTLLEMRDA